MVILTAKLEVAQHDRDLRAGDDEDEEHDEEEAEDVVELVQPDGGQDEEQLDEDRAERQDAPDQNGEHRAHVPGLLRDLARDLVRAHGVLGGGLLEAEVAPDEDERDRDAEPQEDQGEHGAEGDGPRGLLPPDEAVEDEEGAEDDAREEERGLQGDLLPLGALEHLVQAGARVAGQQAHEDPQQEHGGHEAAAVGGGEEAQHRKDHGDERHAEELHPRAHVDAEQARVVGGPEDVAVDQLPASLLLQRQKQDSK